MIALMVLWCLRYRAMLRDPPEMFLVRSIILNHEAAREWEVKRAPMLAGELCQRRHQYRAIDRDGNPATPC